MALVYADRIKLLTTRLGEPKIISEIKIDNVLELDFSPRETFLATWVRYGSSCLLSKTSRWRANNSKHGRLEY